MYLVTCIYSKLYLILNGHWHLFCKTRWLENSDHTTARLIKLIEPVRKWIHHLITIKKEPKAQSYHKIKTILSDDSKAQGDQICFCAILALSSIMMMMTQH